MNFIVFLIFGAIAGWLASILMKTNARQGMLGDIVLGIIGAVVGGCPLRVVLQIVHLGRPVMTKKLYILSYSGIPVGWQALPTRLILFHTR